VRVLYRGHEIESRVAERIANGRRSQGKVVNIEACRVGIEREDRLAAEVG
jgi:hypothetical protein